MARLRREMIRHHSEEHGCDHCGGPVYVGDASYFNPETERAYCSRRCAAYEVSDHEHDTTGRVGAPFVDLGGEG